PAGPDAPGGGRGRGGARAACARAIHNAARDRGVRRVPRAPSVTPTEGEATGQDAEGERRAAAGPRAPARAGAEGKGGGAGRRAAEGRVEKEGGGRRTRTGGGG